MANPTHKQSLQRQLAWLKFQLLGGKGNLSWKYFYYEQECPEDVLHALREVQKSIDSALLSVENALKNIK